MSSREYLDAYIAQNNGVSATAARLGIAYSTLANIVNGYRGISPGMAQRMAALGGEQPTLPQYILDRHYSRKHSSAAAAGNAK